MGRSRWQKYGKNHQRKGNTKRIQIDKTSFASYRSFGYKLGKIFKKNGFDHAFAYKKITRKP